MNKKVIIISSVILTVLVIGAVIGGFYYIQSQNEKLSLSYVIAQCKEEGSYEENTEDDKSYNGTKYVCYNKDYNQIVKFKEDEKSSQETYAFRVETPVKIDDSDRFNYEIARIVIDTTNPKAAKCTYNYRGNADWKSCSERELIKSLPTISIAKENAYKILEPTLKELFKRGEAYSNGDYSQYNDNKIRELTEKCEKQLKVLSNTTLENADKSNLTKENTKSQDITQESVTSSTGGEGASTDDNKTVTVHDITVPVENGFTKQAVRKIATECYDAGNTDEESLNACVEHNTLGD